MYTQQQKKKRRERQKEKENRSPSIQTRSWARTHRHTFAQTQTDSCRLVTIVSQISEMGIDTSTVNNNDFLIVINTIPTGGHKGPVAILSDISGKQTFSQDTNPHSTWCRISLGCPFAGICGFVWCSVIIMVWNISFGQRSRRDWLWISLTRQSVTLPGR